MSTEDDELEDDERESKPNRYVGDYLIEHVPEDEQPFKVHYLGLIFQPDNCEFACYTEEEAVELITKVEEFKKRNPRTPLPRAIQVPLVSD